jgi:hypothetical protein
MGAIYSRTAFPPVAGFGSGIAEYLRLVRWPASGKSKKIAVKKYLTILDIVSRMGLDPGYVSSVSGWLDLVA